MYYDRNGYNKTAKTHSTFPQVISDWRTFRTDEAALTAAFPHMDLDLYHKYKDENGDIDWQEATFGGNHLNSNHTINVSGGMKSANFNFSYNRIDDKSIMYGSDYNRNNLSLKTKFQPIKGLTIAATARYSNTNVLGAGTNSAQDAGSTNESRLRNAVSFVPLPGIEAYITDLDDDTDLGNLWNPIIAIDDSYRKKVDNKLTLSGYVQYKFLKYFTLKAEIGYENRFVQQDRYYGKTTFYARSGDGNAYAGAGYGHSISTSDRTSRLKETNTFEYAQKFVDNAHDFSILIGEEQTINKGELRTMYGYGFDPALPGPQVFNLLGQAKASTIKNYVDPTDNMLSFFARANYNYKGHPDRYASGRTDGGREEGL